MPFRNKIKKSRFLIMHSLKKKAKERLKIYYSTVILNLISMFKSKYSNKICDVLVKKIV